MRYGFSYVLLACCLTSPVWAEDPNNYPTQGTQPFLGLDDTSAPTQIQDGRAEDLQNVLLDISRGARKRYGYKRIGQTVDIAGENPCAVTGLYYTKFSSGTERIFGTCGDRLYHYNGTNWIQNTASGITVTAGQNNQFVWTTAFDSVVGVNDVNVPLYHTGSVYAPVQFLNLTYPIQKAKTVAFFKNFLLFGNTQENSIEHPTRMRWSLVGEAFRYDDDDFIDIGALGGQEINCMAELYDTLIVGLTDSLYKVSFVGGNDVFHVAKITDDIGCIAKNSIQSITLTNSTNGLVFLDKDKMVYFYNGVIVQDISQLITTTLGGLSGSRLQYAVSADTNSDYVLCVTNGTASANNLCLDFQYEIGEWTKHTNIPANAMAHVIDNNTTDQVYWGSDKAFVYQYQDSSLRDDVGSATGTVQSVSTYSTPFQASASILYQISGTMVSGELAGAPLELTGGTGLGQTNTVLYNTTSGVVVSDAWTTTPSTDTIFEVGAIDSFYTTKWYDLGEPSRMKDWRQVYLWADADISSTTAITYADDFSSDIATRTVALSSSSSDAIWGSAIWGSSLWGDLDTVFRQVELTGTGRFFHMKIAEDDPDEIFHYYGWNLVYWPSDVN